MKYPLHCYRRGTGSWCGETDDGRMFIGNTSKDVVVSRSKRKAREENYPGVIVYYPSGDVQEYWENPEYSHPQASAEKVYGDEYDGWYDDFVEWSRAFVR